ncbi:P-loop NTPase fold protein [Actinoplanes sp. NPDC051346]|uniref:P-loop NTPase fold protein n=1 Tax=Actinoplanes sp. NPDC051346 TaxID=3155048 RepID=UPI00343E3DA4
MTQTAESAIGGGGRVELILGDLFESDAQILVAPCSVRGTMTAEVRNQVTRLGAELPVGPFTPGQVIAAPASASARGVTVVFALVAGSRDSDRAGGIDLVRGAASRIGELASSADAVVAVPLLAAGAGGLAPEQSMRAIVAGFSETAHRAATLRIHVLSERLVDRLRPLLPEPGAEDEGEGNAEVAARHSEEVQSLVQRFADQQITAGAVAATAMAMDPGGSAPAPTSEDLVAAGGTGTINDHLEAARKWWSTERVPMFGRTHLVLGLALDARVGWPLLVSGAVGALTARWATDRDGTLWELLSQAGRDIAEDQPMLATALGAPAEWSTTLPAPASLLAFSPAGDRVAALVGREVFDVGADGSTRRVGEVDVPLVSLGWGRDGILGLCLGGGVAEIIRVETGMIVGRVPNVTAGRLGSGLPAWLVGPDEVFRWWGPGQRADDTIVSSAHAVLAVDGTGRRGLVGVGDDAILVSTLTEDQPSAGSQLAAKIGHIRRPEGPSALIVLGKRVAIAVVTKDDRVTVAEPGGPHIANILADGSPIDALATNVSGHCLATASGRRLSVWPVARSRPVSRGVAGYHPDSVLGVDLLDTERDAMALAGLIASERLRPPLAIGLFGEWGSGKTFVLDRIVAMLTDLAASKDQGYVDDITIVTFNAWHYAETNLWASLVDQVLRKVVPPAIEDIPEVEQALRQAAAAVEEVSRVDRELAKADAAVEQATSRLVRRRRTAWVMGGVIMLFAVAAVIAVVAGGAGVVFAAVSGATAVIGYVAAATAQIRNARSQAAEIAETGRAGLGAVGRFTGHTAEESARAAAAHRQNLLDEQRAARTEATRLRTQADRLCRQAESDHVGAVLGQLSTLTEYREQLSLVTRTRERFDVIDKAFVRDNRRVVIAIDDLDRCAAEKVVQVLEAVHLLFNFPMFVVVLAVDTRWLDQSLRIRYHQLLGGTDAAAPSDYLEKIIQIPVRLVPLDESLVRKMITGLTGRAPNDSSAARPDLHSTDSPASTDDTSPPARPASAPVTALSGKETSVHHARSPRRHLPAEVLEITEAEAAAMSAVAPLVGTTPRTVKRFVNTYRLLKARVKDPREFDHRRGGIGDHEVVAFLLAVITGQPAAARILLTTARLASPNGSLRSATEDPDPALVAVHRWVEEHPRFGDAPSHRFADWAPEVARFSFNP